MERLKQIILPTLSLVMVALVMTSLMVIVNHLTFDRIQSIIYADLIIAKEGIFPQAENFTRETVLIDGDEFRYYIVDDNEGYIFITSTFGYGGYMVVVVGINAEGLVVGVEVTEHEETVGLGTRVFAYDYEFVNQFKISYTPYGFTLGDNIDGISGSTVTVDALIATVNYALEIYREVR